MTDNRTTELLSCPFCGGEAEIIETEYSWNLNIEHEPTCFFAFEIETEWTKAKAIATWNTRAELGSGACKLIDTTSPSNDDYWNSAKCSECGAEFTCAIFGRGSNMPDANYCPNCGRKVVER